MTDRLRTAVDRACGTLRGFAMSLEESGLTNSANLANAAATELETAVMEAERKAAKGETAGGDGLTVRCAELRSGT